MINSVNNKSRPLIVRWISIFLLFFYVYNTPIMGFSQFLSTIRLTTLASLFLAVLICVSSSQCFVLPRSFTRNKFRELVLFQFLLFFYVTLLIISIGIGEGNHIVFSIINTFLFSFVPIVAFVILFNNIGDFMKALIWVTVLQTIVVWICIVSPSISQIIDTIFPPTESVVEKDLRDGYAGGISCIAAPGVFKYSLGIISCIYYIVVKGERKYYTLLLTFALTASLIARTGLIISVAVFIFLIYDSFLRSSRRFKPKDVKSLFFVLLAIVLIIYYIINSPFMREQFTRMEYLFEVGAKAAFFNAYFDGSDTIIPEITNDTLLGTGIISGRSANGIYVNADGGYVKVYVAYGLIMAVLFYLFLYSQMISIANHFKDKSLRSFMFVFIVYIIAAEFKEWIVYDMYMLCVFYVMALLMEKEQQLRFINKK